jgi:hypothetical protein
MAEHHDHDHEHDDEEFEEDEDGRVLIDLDEILEEASPEVKEMVAVSMSLSASLAAQNEVLAGQRQAVLDLAMTAVEAAQEILEWSSGEEVEGEEAVETMSSSLARLKEAGEEWESSAQGAEAALRQAIDSPAVEKTGDFRQQALAAVYAAAAQALANSYQNAVAAQQQLNVLGAAVLAQSVELVTTLIDQVAYGDEEDEGEEEPGRES